MAEPTHATDKTFGDTRRASTLDHKSSSHCYDTKDQHDASTQDDTHEQSPTYHSGVTKVEAFNSVLRKSGAAGKALLYTLIVSIGLTMFAYALDQGITYQFTAITASAFSQHSKVGAISTTGQIVRAVSKPFIGKMADVTSRPTTYAIVLVFYAIGFAVAASGTSIAAYAVGYCFTAFGKSGLDLLGDVIVGDLTTLQWRGFWGALLSTPFIVTTFIDGFISDAFIPNNWRWGLGMFAIMTPILLLPAIGTLFTMQAKAKRLGMVSAGGSKMARVGELDAETTDGRLYLRLAWKGIIDIDLFGLVLLGFAFALILLPLNLSWSLKSCPVSAHSPLSAPASAHRPLSHTKISPPSLRNWRCGARWPVQWGIRLRVLFGARGCCRI